MTRFYALSGWCIMNFMSRIESEEKGRKLAGKLMRLAADTLAVRFRFFDVAVFSLPSAEMRGASVFSTDGRQVFYDPERLLQRYLEDAGIPLRAYLHMLLHNLFLHPVVAAGESISGEALRYRNLAYDIAVEQVILDLDLPETALGRDGEEREALSKIASWIPKLTPDRIYRYFTVAPPSETALQEFESLFSIDDHTAWRARTDREEIDLTEELWRKLSRRVKADVKSFSGNSPGAAAFLGPLELATKERYDYADVLKKFAALGEEMRVSDDTFDYIYYTYGLSVYGNMPLVEPLEYRDEKKIREFVIVIDTSASTGGNRVREFLAETHRILSDSGLFFEKPVLHIIQADDRVRKDTVIEDTQALEAYMKDLTVQGFGGTDFRPAFAYVDELIEQNRFENLKGMIYFTDGYGVYPDRQPAYETIFVFTEEDEQAPKLPPWASKVVLEDRI